MSLKNNRLWIYDYRDDFFRNTGLSASQGGVAWPSANLRLYCQIKVAKIYTISGVAWLNGSVVSGNVTGALYDKDGVRLGQTASTAQSGTTSEQTASFSGGNVILSRGIYYVSLSLDNGTGRINRWAPAVGTIGTYGILEEASAYSPPSTATFSLATNTFIPYIGLVVV